MTELDHILDIIREKSPRHAKKLAFHLETVDSAFESRCLNFLRRYSALLAGQGRTLEYGVKSYLDMCQQMVAEQIAFVRSGQYSCSSFEEVEQRVYANPGIMDAYMHGLLMSQFLWRSHYSVLEFFISGLGRHAEAACSYLEIGPGHGLYASEAVASLPKLSRVVALDISQTSLDMAEQLIGNERVTYVCDNFLTHSFAEKFDFIAIGEVIEHVEDPASMLRRVRQCLAPDGVAFVTAPANAPAIDHIYLFNNSQEIRDQLIKAGFEIIEDLVCPTENVTVEVAEQQRLPLMFAAFVRTSTSPAHGQ